MDDDFEFDSHWLDDLGREELDGEEPEEDQEDDEEEFLGFLAGDYAADTHFLIDLLGF